MWFHASNQPLQTGRATSTFIEEETGAQRLAWCHPEASQFRNEWMYRPRDELRQCWALHRDSGIMVPPGHVGSHIMKSANPPTYHFFCEISAACIYLQACPHLQMKGAEVRGRDSGRGGAYFLALHFEDHSGLSQLIMSRCMAGVTVTPGY